MQLRRRIALLTSALVITAPALTACGFNMATDRENSTVAGANNRDGSVDVLNAVLVTAENGSARLVATYSNNNVEEAASVTDVQATDGDVTVKGFSPVEMKAYGNAVPKHSDPETLVKGDSVKRGGYVRLTFSFGDGTSSEVNVPVMAAWEEYAGWGPGCTSEERPEPVGPLQAHGEGAESEHAAEESHEASPSAIVEAAECAAPSASTH